MLPSPEVAPEDLEAVRTALLAGSRRPRKRMSPALWWLSVPVAAIVVAAALWLVNGREVRTDRLVGRIPPARPSPPAKLHRGVVHPGNTAVFSLMQGQPDEVVLLRQGEITVEVEHLAEHERFRVLTGDAAVEVKGTVFSVTAADDRLLAVAVTRGQVVVRVLGHDSVTLGPNERWDRPFAERRPREARDSIELFKQRIALPRSLVTRGTVASGSFVRIIRRRKHWRRRAPPRPRSPTVGKPCARSASPTRRRPFPERSTPLVTNRCPRTRGSGWRSARHGFLAQPKRGPPSPPSSLDFPTRPVSAKRRIRSAGCSSTQETSTAPNEPSQSRRSGRAPASGVAPRKVYAPSNCGGAPSTTRCLALRVRSLGTASIASLPHPRFLPQSHWFPHPVLPDSRAPRRGSSRRPRHCSCRRRDCRRPQPHLDAQRDSRRRSHCTRARHLRPSRWRQSRLPCSHPTKLWRYRGRF